VEQVADATRQAVKCQ